MASSGDSGHDSAKHVTDSTRLVGNVNGRTSEEHLQAKTLRDLSSPVRQGRTEQTTYHYEPLEQQRKQIRLLTLLPGKPFNELRVLLHNIPFDTDTPPKYEALSYAWGSTEDPAFVIVGQLGTRTVSITQNLKTALPYLRYEDRPRSMWIDAICVNQQNVAERSKQVQLMGKIFKAATRVVAWVGTEADDSSLAMEVFTSIGSSIEVDWPQHMARPTDSSAASKIWADVTQAIALSKQEWRAIEAFLFRPWFERLWVQQEIRLGNPSSILSCGSTEISWDHFRRSMFVFREKPNSESLWSDTNAAALYERVDMIGLFCGDLIYQSLEQRIHETRRSHCLDPKDRVYALLSMNAEMSIDLNIDPDYDAPTAQVYKHVAFRITEQTRRLDVLTAAELRPDGFCSTSSWVPDFSLPRLSEPVPQPYASGESISNFEYLALDPLCVRGTPVSRVTSVQKVGQMETLNEVLNVLRKLRLLADLSSPYICGETRLDAYCDALFALRFAERTVPPILRGIPRGECKEFLTTILEGNTGFDELVTTMPKLESYLRRVSMYIRNRTVCTTDQGYLVLGPVAAQPGDQVVVLLGCKSCILLHPAGEDRWQVVGECCVPGLMAGEALAGALPGRYRTVAFFDDDKKEWINGFHNTATHEVQREDPRFDISEYPDIGSDIEDIEWSGLKDKSQRQDDDQKIRLMYPWREANLRKRGVEFQDFYFI